MTVLTVASEQGIQLGLVALAFGLGLRHGIDWDHIAAISDITTTQEAPRRSFVLATLYALGHGLVVLVLGALAIVFAARLPTSTDGVMERVVGVTLLLLGAHVLYTLARDGREFRMRSRWMLVLAAGRRFVRWLRRTPNVVITHAHEHSADEHHPVGVDHDRALATTGAGAGAASPGHHHVHRHVMAMPNDPLFTYGRATSFAVGMIHGVGAETPTQVLLFLTASEVGGKAAGIGLLVCFLLGLFTSNTAIAVLSTFGPLRASHRFPAYAAVSVVIGASSLAIGSLYLVGRGGLLSVLIGGRLLVG